MKRTTQILTFGALVLLLVVIILMFTGCYTKQKATVQHGKAVVTYPEIGADYCARTYPCVDGIVKTDTVITLDTIYTDPEIEILTDTILIQNPFDYVTISFKKDSVYLFHLNKWQAVKNQMAPKSIVKTVTIRDTIRVKDLAELDLCKIVRDEAVMNLKQSEYLKEKYRNQRNGLRWLVAGIGALGLLWLFFAIRKRVINKK